MDEGQKPPPRSPQDAADQLQALGQKLELSGFEEASRHAFMAAAAIDLADPALQQSWGGPMNGQAGRAKAMLALIAATRPAAIVETGAYRGTTTEWFAAQAACPVFTCEIDSRLFHQARTKLARFAHVIARQMDSRDFLREVLPALPREAPALFYLDAHWSEDLPLREELALILEGAARAMIVIDDFQVPFDSGYGWDDYGPGKQLTLDLLEGTAAAGLELFFPSLPSAAETGAKRGCCLLTNDAVLADAIRALRHFRGADWRECAWRRWRRRRSVRSMSAMRRAIRRMPRRRQTQRATQRSRRCARR